MNFLFSFFILSKLHATHGASTHNPEIKSPCSTEGARQVPQHLEFESKSSPAKQMN